MVQYDFFILYSNLDSMAMLFFMYAFLLIWKHKKIFKFSISKYIVNKQIKNR